MNDFSFEDGYIRELSIYKNEIKVKFELWNGNKIMITFLGYLAVKDIHSVDSEIGEMICLEYSQLRQELVKDILAGDGSLDEISEIKSYSFISSWGDRTLLEILAADIKFENCEQQT